MLCSIKARQWKPFFCLIIFKIQTKDNKKNKNTKFQCKFYDLKFINLNVFSYFQLHFLSQQLLLVISLKISSVFVCVCVCVCVGCWKMPLCNSNFVCFFFFNFLQNCKSFCRKVKKKTKRKRTFLKFSFLILSWFLILIPINSLNIILTHTTKPFFYFIKGVLCE